MKIANLIDITPEEIAQLEKAGYVGMNINLATGRIDLVKTEETCRSYCWGKCDCRAEENKKNCEYHCWECDSEEEEIEEEYTIKEVIAEGLRALGITR